MRRALGPLVLLAAACAAPPKVPDVSVWWAPLVTCDERRVPNETLVQLLAEKDIQCILVGDRPQRISVAFERHAEAVALLKAAPVAAQLRIHEIQGGPRSGAPLRRTPPDDTQNRWIEVARFKAGAVDPAEVLKVIQHARGEAGIVTGGTNPDGSSVMVPEQHAVWARQALRASPLRKTVEILW